MRWKDVNLNPTNRLLREFGAILCTICVVIALREMFAHHRSELAIVLFLAAFLFALLAAIRPDWLRPIFVASVIITFPIGFCVSQMILLLLYFGLMTPLAIVFRVSGRDPLNLKPVSEKDETFWMTKTINPDKRSYFKQF